MDLRVYLKLDKISWISSNSEANIEKSKITQL